MGQFGMGQPVRRGEDQRFLTGQGRYTDDISVPGQAHAVILRSPHAHALIRSLDVEAARRAPGVLGVFTAADLARDKVRPIPCNGLVENKDGSAIVAPPYPCLVSDRVRHVGDSVALVVAETRAAAKDAAELIEVDYEALPAAVDLATALDPGQPPVWDEAQGNQCFDWEGGDAAATERAFTRAKHVVELTLVNNRIVANSMEPRGALGIYDAASDRFTLYTSSQGSHTIRKAMCTILRLETEKVRVVTPDVGGGFGMKLFPYREHVLTLYAARKLGRPVKWAGERADAFMTDTHGRDNVTRAALALDADGTFLALRVDTLANLGAYLSYYGPFVAAEAGTAMLAGVYRTPAIHVRVRGAFTHTTPVDAYRGAGRPEAAYVVERIVDAAARQLGVSPAELRRRNFIRPQDMPFTTALGLTYDSGDFARNMDDALAAADHAGFARRRAEAERRGKLRGMGISTYIEQCGGGEDEGARLVFESDGRATLLIGTQSSGQGHETAYRQLVADRLGLAMEDIAFHQGDTDRLPTGRGTGGSRSLPVGGVAVDATVKKVIQKGRQIAAHLLEAAEADLEFADGTYAIVGTDRRVPFREVAKAAFEPARLPPGVTPGIDEKASFKPKASTYPNGCHVCEVDIDPETGAVRIVRFVVVDDFGTVVNPLLLAGQVHGGVVQGIGQALHEICVYEPESGQLITGSFMDYALPRAVDSPDIEFAYNVVPCRTNPLGIKGAGEAGAIGAPPAVINAILDALAPLGIGDLDMPATPLRIWHAIQAARPAAAAE